MDSVLSKLCPIYDHVICLGDVNIDLLNPNNLLSRCFSNYGFVQLIDKPTRVTPDRQSLLDPIFVSSSDIVGKNCDVLNADSISDHIMAYCELNLKAEKNLPRFIQFRYFKYFNRDQFLSTLENQDWNSMIHEPDVNKKLTCSISFFYVATIYTHHCDGSEYLSRRPRGCMIILDI